MLEHISTSFSTSSSVINDSIIQFFYETLNRLGVIHLYCRFLHCVMSGKQTRQGHCNSHQWLTCLTTSVTIENVGQKIAKNWKFQTTFPTSAFWCLLLNICGLQPHDVFWRHTCYNNHFTVSSLSNLKSKLNRIISTALKKAFVAEKSIQKMAKQDFIMVNLLVSSLSK